MTNTDLIRFEALAQHYRSEADICLEMAEQTDGAHRKKAFRRTTRSGSSCAGPTMRTPFGPVLGRAVYCLFAVIH